jgi:endonuclease/exonuclease/phosphatase family metal-dependent hydrolase
MTFNVRGAYRDRAKRNAWPNRAERNARLILEHGPDLIGFQEFQQGNLEFYQEHLPGYDYVLGPAYGNRRPYDWNAIFFDPDRLEVVGAEGFWLSETPERRSKSWGTRVVRSANMVTFEDADGVRFVHVNTHLDHRSQRAKLEGSALVIRRLYWIRSLPSIVTGDFNCRPGSDPYRMFPEAGFTDAYLAAGNTDHERSNTFHAFRGKRYRDKQEHPAPRRLDWVLLRDPRETARVESCYIASRDGEGRIFPSDHYPVVARIVL